MTFLKYNEVRNILSEHTSRCNLRCPQCARTAANGKLNPKITLGDMTPEDYKRLLTPYFCKQLDFVGLCGCYGDPVASPRLKETLDYLINNNVDVAIYTNGSLRSTEWWTDLAKMLPITSHVVFAIDGLTQEINQINRVNSNFRKILNNFTSFINAGGIAHWNYIIFDWNKHQTERAHDIAKEFGFKKFYAKHSTASITTKQFINNWDKNVYKGDDQFKELLNIYGSFKSYIDKTKIKCKAVEMKQIYIDYDLNLWPCPWLGGPLFNENDEHLQKKQLIKLYKKYGKGFNSLKNQSIERAMNHIWFRSDLSNSWENTTDDDNFKMIYCGRTCGEFYKASTVEKENKITYEL
jgi:MoaA/NifB/PqqE/SkfB family radical SAM enzyme